MFRSLTIAAVLGLGLCGAAQAQGTRQEAAPAAAQGAAQGAAQARPAERAAARPQGRTVRTARAQRSATYPGGRGTTWKTGRDSHGFAGTLGGCRFRGHASPDGYRLDRSC